MKYRKKPIVVEAYKVTEGVYEDMVAGDIPLDSLGCPEWIQEAWGAGGLYSHDPTITGGPNLTNQETLRLKTLDGYCDLHKNDWIIKGEGEGDLYPCKPDIFKKTYEEVAE